MVFIPRDTIRSLIENVFPDEANLTFRQLYERFPKVVYISAFCVELCQTHYFSVRTHPDMPVIDALCHVSLGSVSVCELQVWRLALH